MPHFSRYAGIRGCRPWLSTFLWKMIPYCIFGLMLFVIVRVTFLRKRKPDPKKDILTGLFVAYCFGLASQTVIPHFNFGISSSTGRPFLDVFLTNDNASVNLIPFRSIIEQFTGRNDAVSQTDTASVSLLNLLANLLLFSPLGFFIPLLYKKCDGWRRIALAGAAISALIEFIQLFIGRSSDIDDAILNTLGVMLGYCVLRLYKKISSKAATG